MCRLATNTLSRGTERLGEAERAKTPRKRYAGRGDNRIRRATGRLSRRVRNFTDRPGDGAGRLYPRCAFGKRRPLAYALPIIVARVRNEQICIGRYDNIIGYRAVRALKPIRSFAAPERMKSRRFRNGRRKFVKTIATDGQRNATSDLRSGVFKEYHVCVCT